MQSVYKRKRVTSLKQGQCHTLQEARIGMTIQLIVFIVGGRKRCMKRGVPNTLMDLDNRAKIINPQILPTTAVAVQQYRDNGGTISEPCWFGRDPLETNTEMKTIRYESFCSRYSFKSLFCDASNGCSTSFQEALKFLIDVTYRLAHTS